MIEVQNLYKRYGDKTAVDDLSFRVQKGDVLGFIGPNGAGKTTTMKMICGVIPVYGGRISIDQIDVSRDPGPARERIGYLPENAPLYLSMTVYSFLCYAARMHGITDGKELKDKVVRAMSQCGLECVAGDEIESLSKGYRRRVCLAQSILHEPPVLIMDEPTDGLDPNQKREIRRLIENLRKNTAIVLSTHILEEVEAVCTRVLFLSGGKKIFEGTKDEFVSLCRPGEDLPSLFARMTEQEERS